jgi:hypothetical protein
MMLGVDLILYGAFGPRWRSIAPAALRCSRRSVQRWTAGTVRLPAAVRELLEFLVPTNAAIDRWARAEHERVEAMKAEWEAAAGNLRTRLKQMAIEDERNPPSRGGRPKKRQPKPPWLPRPARVPAAAPEAIDAKAYRLRPACVPAP